jgi:hypothetical protein
MAHSATGLIVLLWANRNRDEAAVDAIANPWFDLNANLLSRTLGTAAVDRIGRLKPRTIVGKFSEEYGRANHMSAGGLWDYDLTWKLPTAFRCWPDGLRAVREGHAPFGMPSCLVHVLSRRRRCEAKRECRPMPLA